MTTSIWAEIKKAYPEYRLYAERVYRYYKIALCVVKECQKGRRVPAKKNTPLHKIDRLLTKNIGRDYEAQKEVATIMRAICALMQATDKYIPGMRDAWVHGTKIARPAKS